jgi:Tfp pilus assembly protein PilF
MNALLASTLAATVALATLLGGCALSQPAPPGLLDVVERPAEKALLAGMRAYDDAQYPLAEQQLTKALKTGLDAPRDRAMAHKLLAFIDCTSERIPACEAEFRAARAADPGFALTKSEAGHPLWGPVYRRVRQ